MAEPERPTAQLAATFPAPPPFYQHFTAENLEKLNELRTAQEALSTGNQADQSSQNLPSRLLDLPSELLFLQPPPPPATGIYRVFGDKFSFEERLPSLEEKDIDQLYDTPPITPSGSPESPESFNFILKKLVKSNLLNFLELIGILGRNVELAEQKHNDIRTHFINIHHVLNMYRPHQERESLIMQMEDDVERAKKEIEGIYAAKEKAEDEMQRMSKLEIPVIDGVVKKKADENVEGDNEGLWEVWEELTKQFC